MEHQQRKELEISAGTAAIRKILDHQIQLIREIRESLPVKDADLLSCRVMKTNLVSKDIRNRIAALSQKIRSIVRGIADEIARHDYRDIDEALEKLTISACERKRSTDLLDGDKQIHHSCLSLKIAVQVFLRLNSDFRMVQS